MLAVFFLIIFEPNQNNPIAVWLRVIGNELIMKKHDFWELLKTELSVFAN